MEKNLNIIEQVFSGYSIVEEKYKELIHRDPDPSHPIWKLLQDLPGYGPPDESGLEHKVNRGYIGWHPYGGYLWKDKKSGWDSTKSMTFEEFKEWAVDDLNIPIDFYFSVQLDARRCPHCEEEGLNKETLELSKTWYDLEGDGSNRWCDKLTKIEVDALIRNGRLSNLCKETVFIHDERIVSNRYWQENETGKWFGWPKDRTFAFNKAMEVKEPEFPTEEEVNVWSKEDGIGHDTINRCICVKARAEHIGVYGKCPHCAGRGYFVLSEPYLVLNLWLSHPRKGATRGFQVTHLPEEGLEYVREQLLRAFNIHRFHFAWVTGDRCEDIPLSKEGHINYDH